MPGTVFASIDALLANAADYGPWVRQWFDRSAAANSVPTTSCGGIAALRFPNPVTVPTPTSPLTGVAFPTVRAMLSQAGIVIIGLEFKLGHFVIGTGFTQDVNMPSRWVKGSTIQTAASLVFLVCDTAITGASTMTVTYTNQAGTGSQAATAMVLPSGATIGSAFFLQPNLASGDTGVRAVTNMSNSGATVGTISVRGLLPIGISNQGSGASVGPAPVDPFICSMVPYPAVGGDTIAAYFLGQSGSNMDLAAMVVGVGDI